MRFQFVKNRMGTLIKFVLAGGSKVLATFAAFALTALVTRNLTNGEAGLFLLGFTIVTVFSVVMRLGLDNVVLRFLSAHGANDYAQEKFNRAIVWTLSVSIPFTALGMIFSEKIAKYFFGKPEFQEVLFWILPSIPFISIFYLYSFAFQSQQRVVLTTVFQNLGIASSFVSLVVFLIVFTNVEMTPELLAMLYSTSAFIVALSAIVIWLRQPGIGIYFKKYGDREMSVPALNLWFASMMTLAVQWSGVLIAGVFHSSEEVAVLTAAQRTALLTSFILMIVNVVVAPKYAKYWQGGDIESIRLIAKSSTRGMILLAFPVFIAMLLFPEFIMSLFGAEYAAGGHLLAIMAVGQLVNVMTGSVGYLLNMSGHERDYNLVTMFSGPLAIGLAFIFSMYWGVTGTAVAISIGVGVQHLGAAVMVKKRLGFYSLF